MNYTTCSNIELAKFVADRDIELPTDRPQRTRQDLLKALQKADKNRTFPFLDLHPELRNRVYEELRVFKNSFTCQPKILATCKQVQKEASSILYGENLIEVKMWNDGVYANGWKCGDYDTSKPDFTRLWWPSFLKRAQFVGFSLGADFIDTERNHRPARIENVFYSLCKFLAKGHNLRSLEVDLTRYCIHGRLVDTTVNLSAFNMLGALKQLTVDGEVWETEELVLEKTIDLSSRTWTKDFLITNHIFLDECRKLGDIDRSTLRSLVREFMPIVNDISIPKLTPETAEEVADTITYVFQQLRRAMEERRMRYDEDFDVVVDNFLGFDIHARWVARQSIEDGLAGA